MVTNLAILAMLDVVVVKWIIILNVCVRALFEFPPLKLMVSVF